MFFWYGERVFVFAQFISFLYFCSLKLNKYSLSFWICRKKYFSLYFLC